MESALYIKSELSPLSTNIRNPYPLGKLVATAMAIMTVREGNGDGQ